MQMSSGSGLQSEINVTPLVDVVLVLLIIFMVVVPLIMQGYDVDTPPTSAETVPAPTEPTQVVLGITPGSCGILQRPEGIGLPADCRVSLDEQDIAASELPARMAEVMSSRPTEQRVVFLAADDRLNYEGVLRIVDLAKSRVDDLTIEVIATD